MIWKTIGSPSLVSFLLIVPLLLMEIINRRDYQEEFPFFLFFFLWFNLFAVCLIWLRILHAWQMRLQPAAESTPVLRGSLLTRPRSAAVISAVLFLFPLFLAWLDSIGWVDLQPVFNGPRPEQQYWPGLILSLGLVALPVAAGMIASNPIVKALRAGGSLFAYPLHLLLTGLISASFAAGFASLLIDQWSCFLGVPLCD